jgi:hypothetical protein
MKIGEVREEREDGYVVGFTPAKGRPEGVLKAGRRAAAKSLARVRREASPDNACAERRPPR